MSNDDAVRGHLRDAQTVVSRTLNTVERQLKNVTVREKSEFNELLIRIERSLKAQESELRTLSEVLGSAGASRIRHILADTIAVTARLFDAFPSRGLSRMLLEDYAALSGIAAAYMRMHASGVASGKENVAEMAERHLKNIPPLLHRLRATLPLMVAAEMTEYDALSVISDAGARASKELARIWRDEPLLEMTT